MTHAGTALINPESIFKAIGLQPGMRVADLGCGRTCHFVFPAATEVGAGGLIYAVDVLKDVLQSIESRVRAEGYSNVQTVWSDIESGKTPIPNDSLDVCFVVNVLYQIKNKEAVMKEGARLVKKGGYVVVIDWKKNLGGIGPSLRSMVDQTELLKIAGKAGLTLTNNVNIGDHHFCLVLNKL